MKKNEPMREYPLMEPSAGNLVLFHPHIPSSAGAAVNDVLAGRWIGQGPRVDEFERRFAERFAPSSGTVAVGSGTDALHLSYVLANLRPGDEVIAPIFTCTATSIPLLHMGVKVVFADVQADTLNMDPDDVRRKVTEKTKAIACVHYGGLPCDMDALLDIANEFDLRVVEDAAHALGATYRGTPIGTQSDFSIYSFQAIKHITTGDGGMLVLRDASLLEKAKRLRWFGIDRKAKQGGIWENDIVELGFKYQMTDIGAAMGLCALDEFDTILSHRQRLLAAYASGLENVSGCHLIGNAVTDRTNAAWLCTVLSDNREGLQEKLRQHQIESAQVHYRNDRYSIFGGRSEDCPNMDALESRYLVLPLHTKMRVEDVERVCDVIKGGW